MLRYRAISWVAVSLTLVVLLTTLPLVIEHPVYGQTQDRAGTARGLPKAVPAATAPSQDDDLSRLAVIPSPGHPKMDSDVQQIAERLRAAGSQGARLHAAERALR